MTSRLLPALTLAALACAASLPSAAPAKLRESRYDVTFEVRMLEEWKSEEHVSKSCQVNGDDGRCLQDAVGSGQAKVVLRTPTPQRVSVMTGARGMQPMITFATDSGIPLKGSYRRTGSFTDVYSGLWDGANPDFVAPASGCGDHAVKTDVALGWTGRNEMAPVLLLDELPDCPTGPYTGFDYGSSTPNLGEVVARAGETRFGRAKQFRITGARTWKGTIAPVNRTDPDDMYSQGGESSVTWAWEATFRLVKPKKKRRRA